MKPIHKELAEGRWFQLSLCEQLGNIGSEVGRAQRWFNKDEKLYQGAVERTLELFDLTLADSRWKGRLREIGRLREVFCDAITGGKEYKSTLKGIERYLFPFAFLSRR
ncbi:hypothetical protein KAU40_00055 [Candidatus Parcubacteria bacterium]|nr:hypothetical protein [Candidatus Parcubacteria bacterium]